MTNEELIARQAKQLEELRDENANLKECARKVKAIIYCIGGPLNDNVKGYTKDQLTTFFRIVEELEADNDKLTDGESASRSVQRFVGTPKNQ